ncbi:hypothetical protein [Arcobacter sp. FWKO B]|uniref:hypothetical protein n=1 Tax=Arcobacter sp. FWKO B TaxID=2593672 RepID=UPI0018A59ABA|nr:hypothetical protein [Arcobacter sp. FWKO B]QOG11233.1 hypothetical protein FWKOB_00365 [Arcobacter sp. FWKO B]
MKKLSFVVGLLVAVNIYAQDKLDILDKQSQEFFKAITGLEKDYLEAQMKNISISGRSQGSMPSAPTRSNQDVYVPQGYSEGGVVLSQEEYIRNTFNNENELARIKTDFARITTFKDLKIKSMYSFNGQDYAVLYLDDGSSAQKINDENTFLIEGRYKKGDMILGHKVVSLNTRTKKIELYKELDSEYGYYIYLSNYGVGVSDLKKNEKPKQTVASNNTQNTKNQQPKTSEPSAIQKVFDEADIKTTSTQQSNCLYKVNVKSLNVRNQTSPNATILRILRQNDKFSISKTQGDWVLIDTIHKHISGDIMDVKDQNNWVNIVNNNADLEDDCKE